MSGKLFFVGKWFKSKVCHIYYIRKFCKFISKIKIASYIKNNILKYDRIMSTSTAEAIMLDMSTPTFFAEKINYDKVTIFGAGTIGASCLYALVSERVSSDLVLIDKDLSMAQDELEDIQNASVYMGNPNLTYSTDYEKCRGSRVVVLTAGQYHSPLIDLDLAIMEKNVSIYKEIIPQILNYSPKCTLVVVTRPVDIMSYVAWKISGLPSNRVIGTGCSFLSSRFRDCIAEKLNVSTKLVQAYVIGENSTKCVPVWSSVSACGIRLRDINPELGTANDPEDWQQVFRDILQRRLVELDLLEPLVGQILTSLIHIRIENHIAQTCKLSYEISHIEPLEKWLNTIVMPWLTKIYCVDSNIQTNEDISKSMDNFQKKLSYFLLETYTKTRINQLFNIIIEYPESIPAIEDLHACLPKTDLRPYLIQTLQLSLQTRLLHPGVSTPDILTAYVAVIRSLRVLDPSGVLLDIVTQPIHQYLRSRDDTVRCVVGSLNEEGPNDLADELVKGEALHLDEHSPEDEDENKNWETWNPDPVDVDKSKTRKNRRTSDIISMLVNVYGSKELFVNEYRTLLADRLLTQFSYNTEKEIRYLELLKLRFGETQLHYCEVMLKDICDSKRINTHLQNDEEYKAESKNFPVSALILSAQFWPAFKDETLELPEIIKEQFQYYTNGFETLKGNRTLCWKPHLGTVELDVELANRTVTFTVSPLHATIIMHFQNKEQWTIDELSQEMKVPATLLRKKIGFWQSQGLLREINSDIFVLIEDDDTNKDKGQVTTDIICEDDESESAMASSQDQREEELQVFWSYIIGMLTNLDSMPLERIHQMLKMFASQGPTAIECSLQELRHFLDRKVREHKLLFTGGYYRLPKN